jgi:hypothetical protein
MMRMLKGLAWLVGIVLIVLVLAFAWGRLRGPSELQSKALVLLDQDMKPTRGRNAFPAIWLSDYDVPVDQINLLYAQDRQRVHTWVTKLESEGSVPSDFIAPSADKYQKLPPLTAEEKELTCGNREENCLSNVRAHRDEVRALLTRQSVRLRHDEELGNYDFDWNDLPPNSFTPYPPYGSTHNMWLTSAALDFVEGKSTSALQQACTNIANLRRLHGHENTLVGTMVNAVRMEAVANVFVHMVSELPVDQQLPDTCAEAFATVGLDDVNLCASMQWEFRVVVGEIDLADRTKKPTRWLNNLIFSKIGTQRQKAAQFGWICSDRAHRQLLDDHRFAVTDFPSEADVFDWLSNASGSVLVFIPQPVYADYLNRQEDAAATLRLVATILWLRQTYGSGKTLAERLPQRPVWMRITDDRGLQLSSDGRSLHMGYHGPGKTGIIDWPLPAGL